MSTCTSGSAKRVVVDTDSEKAEPVGVEFVTAEMKGANKGRRRERGRPHRAPPERSRLRAEDTVIATRVLRSLPGCVREID